MGATIQAYRDCLGGTPCRFGRRNFTHSAVIAGPSKLHAADLVIPDLRAGFSHLIAALAAEGTSRVYGVDLINRGYEDFEAQARRAGRPRRAALTPERRSERARLPCVACRRCFAASPRPSTNPPPSDEPPSSRRGRAGPRATPRASRNWARQTPEAADASARRPAAAAAGQPQGGADRRERPETRAGAPARARHARRRRAVPARPRPGPGAGAGARHRRLPPHRRHLLLRRRADRADRLRRRRCRRSSSCVPTSLWALLAIGVVARQRADRPQGQAAGQRALPEDRRSAWARCTSTRSCASITFRRHARAEAARSRSARRNLSRTARSGRRTPRSRRPDPAYAVRLRPRISRIS